jgi:hypothetical protein
MTLYAHRFGKAAFCLGLAAALLPSGCVQRQAGLISEEPVHIGWLETITAMGYVTVHPPQEDVRVGDLLICDTTSSSMSEDHSRYLLSATRWSMVDVDNLLETEYTTRGEWPETPDMYYHVEADPSSRQWTEAAGAEGQSIYTNRTPPGRLRSVAAGLIAASWDQAGNNILVPTEAINMAMGTAWEDEKSVTFRVGSAEEYSLSIDKIIPSALEKRNDAGDSRYYLKDAYIENLAVIRSPSANSVNLALINEVLYIRSLDISVQAKAVSRRDQKASPGGLSVSVETTSAPAAPAPATAPADPNDPNASPATAPPPASQPQKEIKLSGHGQSVDPGLASYIRAQALNKSIMEADYDDLPEVFTRFISVSDESVALRKIWRRGLAIGVKGLVLQVDTRTGELLSSQPMIHYFQSP